MQALIDQLQGKIKSYKKQIEEAEEIAALNLAKYAVTARIRAFLQSLLLNILQVQTDPEQRERRQRARRQQRAEPREDEDQGSQCLPRTSELIKDTNFIIAPLIHFYFRCKKIELLPPVQSSHFKVIFFVCFNHLLLPNARSKIYNARFLQITYCKPQSTENLYGNLHLLRTNVFSA